jgi:hypothetical protein
MPSNSTTNKGNFSFKQNNAPKTSTSSNTPAEQAHAMGLVYGGFGGWIHKQDPDRKVVARTIDGKLIRVSDDEDGGNQDLGRINVFRFDPEILSMSTKNPSSRFVWKYNAILKSITKMGSAVMIVPRGTEHTVADYLRRIGIDGGVKLAPITSDNPNLVRDFVAEKIEQGFSNVQYFDTNEKAVNAVDSLHAQYNKKDNLHLKTHQLTGRNAKQSNFGK